MAKEKKVSNLEELKLKLDGVLDAKQAKHDELLSVKYDIILKKNVNAKKVFYLMSKIDWQGKEALGVIRLNEVVQNALQKDASVSEDSDTMKLNSTEMNALLYLLLRIKSNSKDDAKIYVDHIFPMVHELETKVVEAKNAYDSAIKPLQEESEKLASEITELETAETETNEKSE